MPTLMFISNAPFLGATLVSQTTALDLDGTTECLSKQTDVDIGIGNAWSILNWWKPTVNLTTEGGHLVHLCAALNTDNAISIVKTPTADMITVALRGVVGNDGEFKRYRWDNTLTLNQWISILVTWDGTSLLMYQDGSVVAPDATDFDDAGTQASTDRRISIGSDSQCTNDLAGIYHSSAMWDVALTSAEATAIYNSGVGGAFDLDNDSGDYVSSVNLLHWWRFALETAPVSAIGQDFGKHTTLINLMDDAENITADDAVVDSPP